MKILRQGNQNSSKLPTKSSLGAAMFIGYAQNFQQIVADSMVNKKWMFKEKIRGWKQLRNGK